MRFFALLLSLAIVPATFFAQTQVQQLQVLNGSSSLGIVQINVVPSGYYAQEGDDLYTLTELNRMLAERAGQAGDAPTWQRVKAISPALVGLPVVMRSGKPYVYFRSGTRIEGLTFLERESDAAATIAFFKEYGGLPLTLKQGTKDAVFAQATAGSVVVVQSSYDWIFYAVVLGALFLAILAVAGGIFCSWFFDYVGADEGFYPDTVSLDDAATTNEAPSTVEAHAAETEKKQEAPRRTVFATRPNQETFDAYRAERIANNPFDPEYMLPSNWYGNTPHAEPATPLHSWMSRHLGRQIGSGSMPRQIVSVRVTGGIWKTLFEGDVIHDAQPMANDLVVGVYLDEDGAISLVTLHWRFCLNGVPLDRLDEDERYFITDETVFSQPELLANDTDRELSWDVIERYLREHHGVRADRPRRKLKLVPRVAALPAAGEEIVEAEVLTAASTEVAEPEVVIDPAHGIAYRLVPYGKFARSRNSAPCGSRLKLIVSVRGGAEQEFTDFCGIFFAFTSGTPRVLRRLKETHLDHGITFMIVDGLLAIRQGSAIIAEGIDAGSSGIVAFPDARPASTVSRRRARKRDLALAA